MPHSIRTAALGLIAALCTAVVAALGIGISPSTPVAQAQTNPTATSLSSSGNLEVAFAGDSDARFPAGAAGIKLNLDIDITVQQNLTGSGAVMRTPVLQVELHGDGTTFNDNSGGATRRTVPLSLTSSESSCTTRGVASCTIDLDRQDIQLPPLRLEDDAAGTIVIEVTLSGFGLHRRFQPSVVFAAPQLEALGFTDRLELTVGPTDRISDPRLYIHFPDDSDNNVSAGVGTDGQGRAPVGLALEFAFTRHRGESISGLEMRLDSYGRVEVPRLLGSTGLEVEKSGLGGLSTGDCQAVSASSNRWRCELTSFTATALVPRDLALGTYSVSGNARLLGLTLRYDVLESGASYSESRTWDDFTTAPATRRLTVSDALEVHSATLQLAEGEPSVIVANGGQTRLRLSVLNENGGPSHPKQILLIFVTASRGSLRLAGGEICGSVCTLTSEQLADFAPGDTAAIDFILTAGAPGTASVKATINSVIAGGAITAGPIEVDFSGAPAEISLAAPSGSLHHVSGADPVTLKISATDANGIRTAAPALRLNILDPNGVLVPRGQIRAEQRKDEIVLTTVETRDNALTPGDYTVRALSGGFSADQTVTVSGPPAQIEASVSPLTGTRIGQIVTITATVTDAQSKPIANGLGVQFQALNDDQALIPVGDGMYLSQGGRANGYFAVTQGGASVIVISAGDEVNITSVLSNAPSRSADSPLISDKTPDGRAVWLAATNVSTQFVPRLRRAGILGIWARSDNKWVGYAVEDDGQRVPGSVQFVVKTGDVIYPIP